LVTLLAYVVVDTPGIPSSDRAMAAVPTTGVSDFAALEQAIRLADRHAPQGTAILVLGSRISWHDQLWAPQWSDRPFFYDDWLWYWQKDHVGPYDPLTEHAYDIDSATLTQSYFSQHGIGAVVVTGEAARAASRSLLLNEIASGTYSVYTVLGAVGIVTSGDSTAGDIEIENQRIAASFGSPVSTALVRRNWYPRWKATIGDHTAGVEKDDAGYMRVSGVGPGSLVELTYQVDAWDWMSRLLCVAGLAGTGALVVAPRRMSELDIPSKMLGKIRSARRMLI
jgi:hypothetical protein